MKYDEQQAIFDTLPAMIWLKDKDNRILRANRAAAESIGRTPEEIEGRSTYELYPEQARKYHLDDLEVIASGKPKLDIVEKYETVPGETRWVRTDKTPYRDADGNVAGVVVVATDVTAWKQGEEERNRLYEQLKELDEVKTRFFANVSHELRTPIALVLALAERLGLARELGEREHRDVEVIAHNARALARQVNDLLDLAKMDAGRVEVDYVRTDLAELVRRTASYFEPVATERGVALSVEAPGALFAEMDEEKIARVLTNLLSNAFRYAPKGGAVVCRLEAQPEGRVRIVVDDSGPGVPEAYRARVFERFYQVGGEPADGGGTGLGLAIAKELVRLHRGEITADVAPLGGARFVVEFPSTAPDGARIQSPFREGAARIEAARAEVRELCSGVTARPTTGAHAAPEDARDERPRVLVVEDNVQMNRYLADALGETYSVSSAFDGEQGTELAFSLLPDAIIADLMMPRVGGSELVRRVRANPALDGVPILILTARADETQRVRLLEQGAQDYVTKPFALQEVRARLGNLVAMKRARDTLQAELSTCTVDVELLATQLVAQGHQLRSSAEALRFARDQAERASAMKTSFQRLVTHELATPLTTIKLGLELAQRSQVSPAQSQALKRCASSVNRLSVLIAALLEHARIESGQLKLEVTEIDLPTLVADVVEEMRPVAEAKSLALVVRLEQVPRLRSDARLVRLIASNLLANALKFTTRGYIEVSVEESRGALLLAVKDTGRGIAAREHARIFEAFAQLDDLDSTRLPGVGLGLALVREMASALSGTIELGSEVGVGSTFTVTLRDLEEPAHAIPTSA